MDLFGLHSGWSVEPPPDKYASGPTQTGRTTETPNLTPEQATWLCNHYGAKGGTQRGDLIACYVPSIDQIVAPAAQYWPSATELKQILNHEWAHARGWRHNDDGTGTGSASLPPVPSWLPSQNSK